ncbi:MAG: hypothetical protein HC867_00980 [Bacteroidia bacterium]|nr:hypothetical protein [Bacteroidia bacterium]
MGGALLKKGNDVFVLITHLPAGGQLKLDMPAGKIKSIKEMATGNKMMYKVENDKLLISNIAAHFKQPGVVLKIETINAKK